VEAAMMLWESPGLGVIDALELGPLWSLRTTDYLSPRISLHFLYVAFSTFDIVPVASKNPTNGRLSARPETRPLTLALTLTHTITSAATETTRKSFRYIASRPRSCAAASTREGTRRGTESTASRSVTWSP
jgi:hypothetical protein